MPRQAPQFQQTDQPGPQQRAQSPPFRHDYNRRGPNNAVSQQGFQPSAVQQNKFRPRTGTSPPPGFPPFRDQQDGAALRTALPPKGFQSHPDDIEASEAMQPRRRKGPAAGRRITPGPAHREGNRPGASLRCAVTLKHKEGANYQHQLKLVQHIPHTHKRGCQVPQNNRCRS